MLMERRPPGVIRERISRLTGSRVSTALVFDRDLGADELASFSSLPPDGDPRPSDFVFEARVVRYECEADDAAKWRLALEIYLVKALRNLPASRPRPRSTGIRDRAHFRKLHLG